MSLSAEQIKYINDNFKGKTAKEIRDMIGFFYKQRIRKFIKERKEPKSIQERRKKSTKS